MENNNATSSEPVSRERIAEELPRAYKLYRLLALAVGPGTFASMLIVALIVKARMPRQDVDDQILLIMRIILYSLAFFLYVFSGKLRGLVLARPSVDHAKSNFCGPIQKLFNACYLGSAASVMPVVGGFVLFVLGRNWVDFGALLFIAAAGFVKNYMPYAFWESAVQVFFQDDPADGPH